MEAHREGYAENLYPTPSPAPMSKKPAVPTPVREGGRHARRSAVAHDLPLITRRSLVQVAQDLGMTVTSVPSSGPRSRPAPLWSAAWCGTAAVISPVG